MNIEEGFVLRGRNPDVLTCIANLSNDEVFTPPEFANRMLDTVAAAWAEDHNGADIWADKNTKFLDPCAKSGVFLREITKRLIYGLEAQFPDLQERVDHILTEQVYGIGTTLLTSLISRRSLYCSKIANGTHSVAKTFLNEAGHIWFERTEHTWSTQGKCKFCGANINNMDRGDANENHAYAFIHNNDSKKWVSQKFGSTMQFDVVIGNPPYQLQDASGSSSATPIYHKFIEQAIELDPKFLVMVTPSRWFSGGKGLNDFRSDRLTDGKMRVIVDYILDKDAFPKVNVNGGVNYFLWSKDNNGDCSITTVEPGGIAKPPVVRSLSEFDIFIRRNESVSILRKVSNKGEKSFSHRVSSRKPFGLPTNFFGSKEKSASNPIKMFCSGKTTWSSMDKINNNKDIVYKWKVLLPRASDGNEKYPLPIWDRQGPFISGPMQACSETYLIASVAEDRDTATFIRDYLRTKFVRFLVSLRKITQDNKSDIFKYVPEIPFNKSWTDEELYLRYKLSSEEILLIEEIIRTMEWPVE